MVLMLRFLTLFLLLLLGPSAGYGQTMIDKKLMVSTKHTPPFAIKNDDGTWSGVSIDLWREIAQELGLNYEFKEFDLQGLLGGIQGQSGNLAQNV